MSKWRFRTEGEEPLVEARSKRRWPFSSSLPSRRVTGTAFVTLRRLVIPLLAAASSCVQRAKREAAKAEGGWPAGGAQTRRLLAGARALTWHKEGGGEGGRRCVCVCLLSVDCVRKVQLRCPWVCPCGLATLSVGACPDYSRCCPRTPQPPPAPRRSGGEGCAGCVCVCPPYQVGAAGSSVRGALADDAGGR